MACPCGAFYVCAGADPLILAFYSFTESTAIGAVRGFSLQNYVTLFTMEELRDMIVGTLTLAVGAAGIASVLGTLGAVGAFYSRPSTRAALETANRIPVTGSRWSMPML